MEEIIQWLMKIEHLAHDIYSRAAIYFNSNRQLMEFLRHSAEDEAWHYHAMASAAQHYRTGSTPPQSISLDTETRERIEGIFNRISEQITDRSLSEHIILDHIKSAEFSEWNDIFLYVVSCLKEQVLEFKYVAAKLQNHKRYIESFLEGSLYGQELLRNLRDIPAVWTESILVVDDEETVAALIKAILHREGTIDTAVNGYEGLQRLKEKYYKLVISDVDMPIMNGLSFFNHAVELYPAIKERFLFISGDPSPDRLAFFRQHNLRFLPKPAPVNVIRQEALRILLGQEER